MRIPVRRNCRKYSVAMPVAQWVWGQGRPEKIPVSSLAGSELLGKAVSPYRDSHYIFRIHSCIIFVYYICLLCLSIMLFYYVFFPRAYGGIHRIRISIQGKSEDVLYMIILHIHTCFLCSSIHCSYTCPTICLLYLNQFSQIRK